MKNKDIHKNLPDAEIRDFLASQINNAFFGESAYIEKKIKELQEQLEKAKKGEAVILLMKQKGWEDFDISDHIEDYQRDSYFPFIGTKHEYEQLAL